MTLKGKGLLVKKIEAFTDELVLKKAQQVANDALDTALFLVPVDTGWLKKNIKTEITKIKDGYRVTLYVDLAQVHYAIYVEMGTYKMVAQPYITPSILTAFHRNF
jgi:HK97 gp10 family phage protein